MVNISLRNSDRSHTLPNTIISPPHYIISSFYNLLKQTNNYNILYKITKIVSSSANQFKQSRWRRYLLPYSAPAPELIMFERKMMISFIFGAIPWVWRKSEKKVKIWENMLNIFNHVKVLIACLIVIKCDECSIAKYVYSKLNPLCSCVKLKPNTY